ncbi:DMT family transporter [Spirobacillus cienkowskii]|uniref:DMT family transporter n=1 Tax=Spirobacillus cienkowskii TaxID=495820 RepID=UPI0030D20366
MKATNFNQTLPYAFLTLSTLFWGGNLIVGKLLVLNISPILLTQIRWILTAAFLFLIYHKKIIKNWGNIKSSFAILCLLSLCGQVFFPLNLYISLQYTNPINAAIYLSASPCLVIIINKLVFKDFVTVKSLFGIIISTFGVVYLIIKGDFFNLRQFFNLNIGDFWAMGSALSWSIYCSFLRLKNKNISGNVFVTVSAIIASVFLIPISFFYQFDLSFIQSSFSLYAFIGILYLIIFPSWLAYLFWNKGIEAIGATRGEVFTHFIPLFSVLLSVIILKENLYHFQAISAIFILIGIYFCSKKQNEKVLKIKEVKL